MSSSGIRDIESTDDRVRRLTRERNSDIINSYKNAEEETTLSSGGSSASTGSSPSGNYMKRDGDEWLAVFGNDFDIGIINGGFVNISKINGLGRRLTILNAEGGSPDNLDTLFPFPDPLLFFEKYIQIVSADVTLRPVVIFTITNIVGNGVDDVITVTVASTGTLADDDFVDVVSTLGNFTSPGLVPIFNTTATTFQFNLGTIGSTTPETSGTVLRGNLKLPNDVDFLAPEGTFLHFIFDTASQQMVLDYASNGLGGGGGNIPDGTIENEHLEWNNSTVQWEAKVNLEFGSTGPFADSGFLRFANDQIIAASRNLANDGNMELKITGAGLLDFTESANNAVGLQLRAQNATNPDATLAIIQTSDLLGLGGTVDIDAINSRTLSVSVDGTGFWVFDGDTLSNKALQDIEMNLKNITEVNELHGRDDGTTFKIIFDIDEDGDTAITSNVLTSDRIDVFANNINGTFFLFNSTNSEFQMGIPNAVAAYWSLGDHRLEFDAMTIPLDSVIGNDSGVVFLDTASDPPILKIKKKDTVGAISVVSLEGAGGGASPLTTKGDVFGFDTADARIPIGTNNQVLTADSAEALGLKWADLSVGATVLNDLTDVTIAIPQKDQTLLFDAVGGVWRNQDQEGLDGLSFKVINPQSGEFGSSEVWYSARVNATRRINESGTTDDFFANVSPGIDVVFWIPVIMPKKFTFNALAIHAIVGTGSTQLSIGFYESDPDTLEPTDLIVASNNFTLGAGDNVRTTGNISRDAGLYYFAYKQETNPAPGVLKIRAIEPDAIGHILGFENGESGFTLGSTTVIGFTGDFTTTGLPSSFAASLNETKITAETFSFFVNGPPEVFARITSWGL